MDALATLRIFAFNSVVAESDNSDKKAKALYSRCNRCGSLIKWIRDWKTGKNFPSIPGKGTRHKCRNSDQKQENKGREGYIE